jgi:hypothetical protein
MKGALHRTLWRLLDRVFPIAQPHSAEEQKADSERRTDQQKEWEARTSALPAQEESLVRYFAACRTALDDERQRQQGADARLTTIIGLSSIAGTVVFGTMLTTMPRTPSVLSWLMLLSLGYLILQLVCAMLAGVRGLERRAYDTMPCTDLLPSGNEASTDYCRRQIQQFFAILVQNQDQNNAKMTQMAVAHCAMKNFIGGLMIFAVLAGIHHVVERPSNELVNRLKTDHVLRELLRGPQGQPGPAGPKGPPGLVPVVPAPTGSAQSPLSKKPDQKQ